jgi:cytochrome b involved in lipid metabolism
MKIFYSLVIFSIAIVLAGCTVNNSIKDHNKFDNSTNGSIKESNLEDNSDDNELEDSENEVEDEGIVNVQTNATINNVTNVSNTTSTIITSSQLATHNIMSNCWISYKGKVYDITSWLPIHPGSAAAILPYCGTSTQFENAFTGQHGTSQVDTLIQEGIYKGVLQ